jgi:hypothetical protein
VNALGCLGLLLLLALAVAFPPLFAGVGCALLLVGGYFILRGLSEPRERR